MRMCLPVSRDLAIAAVVWALGASACFAAPKLPAPERDLVSAEKTTGPRTLVLAAGCFWCVEAVFEGLEGVTSVVSGYAGGRPEDAIYQKVAAGSTEHAEAVRITYDPTRISFGRLLHVFFSTHDPTTLDRQGPDVGPQYRSAIFSGSDDERAIAEAYIRQLDATRLLGGKIVTKLEPFDGFFEAEAYHQDFVAQHPEHPYVKRWALPKLEKLKATFPTLVRSSSARGP